MTPGIELPRLCLITDAARLGADRVLRSIANAAQAGLRFVQVREKALPDRELVAFSQRCREVLCAPGILTVNATGRSAETVRACGVGGAHVGGGEATVLVELRQSFPPPFALGFSAHTQADVVEAARLGADYVFLSPVFSPNSKTTARASLGLEGLAVACAGAPIPVYALGGVGPESAYEVRKSGAYGAAVIGAILDAQDPREATRGLIRGLERPI